MEPMSQRKKKLQDLNFPIFANFLFFPYKIFSNFPNMNIIIKKRVAFFYIYLIINDAMSSSYNLYGQIY